jgi:hypothetical protein
MFNYCCDSLVFEDDLSPVGFFKSQYAPAAHNTIGAPIIKAFFLVIF